ncbi:MAG TPA: ABC transporter permease [Bacteroidales bacterium]|nr:ABC transporter permease [Bacteroidales bacterium]
MLRNYFKIAFRNFTKNKVFSLINISGLAIAISASLVIYLIVQFEFSFEKSRKDADRIYRVVTDITFPGEALFRNSGVPMPMPKAVRSELPGIEIATHFVTAYEPKISVPAGNQPPTIYKKQSDVVYADEFYFSMFEYNWLAGSKLTALKDPNQVVITEEKAKTFFGNISPADIIGKQIFFNDSIVTTVSGIVKAPADKATNFHFSEYISLATLMSTNLKNDFGGDEWQNVNSASQFFVKLKPGIKPEQLNAKFAGLRKKYLEQKPGEKDDTKNHLQALTDIHFNPEYDAIDQRQAHKPTLYGLMAVAAFLLLLGCINFINLTTAQAAQRAKEIGIRKTLGSSKGNLIIQFLVETFLLTLIATVFSIVITPWLLKVFSDFIPPEITMASVNQVHVWLFLSVLILLMTFLSGFYPAVILTKFKPVTVLKNQVGSGSAQSRSAWFRKTLTVTQFVIAQFLVIATLVVSKQINYSLNKDLGYKKEAIVTFNTIWNFFSNKEDNRRFALFEKLKSIPGIEKASLGGSAPAHNGASSTTMKVFNGKKEQELMVETMNADPEYFGIYTMKLVAGKLPEQSDTTKEYLVNESFAKAFGYANPADIIGKNVERGRDKIPIVGVLADFQTKSTHDLIKPLAFSSARKNSYVIHLALKSEAGSPGQWKATLAKVETEYKKLYPDDEFKINFFDETIASFYKREQDISRLLNWSAGLCIFISCLGLFGLVIYTTNTRTKEIGVRKVLGASVAQIVTLLSKDLVSLVLVAFVIAAPLAWLAMNKWLQDFAFRTQISWWVFVVCCVGMLLIALFVLSIRTIGAALANPVKSLRTE